MSLVGAWMPSSQSLRRLPGIFARSLVRVFAGRPYARSALNRYYNDLDVEGQARFHRRYARLFHHHGSLRTPGEWTVRFRGKAIRLPLRPEHSWIDWAIGLSVVGHDPEVKATYDFLLSSSQPPQLFLDIGANYGTHSILFASQGVRAIAFEPNPKCRDYCRTVCGMNGLDVEWQPVALGDRQGEVELVYPGDETWLGSVVHDIAADLRDSYEVIASERVKLGRLDDYADAFRGRRILMKIDVEGSEAQVLKGASGLLERSKPTIIFESNDPTTRPALLALLAEHRYAVLALPYSARASDTPLSGEQFGASPATNFLALWQG